MKKIKKIILGLFLSVVGIGVTAVSTFAIIKKFYKKPIKVTINNKTIKLNSDLDFQDKYIKESNISLEKIPYTLPVDSEIYPYIKEENDKTVAVNLKEKKSKKSNNSESIFETLVKLTSKNKTAIISSLSALAGIGALAGLSYGVYVGVEKIKKEVLQRREEAARKREEEIQKEKEKEEAAEKEKQQKEHDAQKHGNYKLQLKLENDYKNRKAHVWIDDNKNGTWNELTSKNNEQGTFEFDINFPKENNSALFLFLLKDSDGKNKINSSSLDLNNLKLYKKEESVTVSTYVNLDETSKKLGVLTLVSKN